MASRTQAVEVVDAIGLLSLALERWRSTFARKYGLVDNDAIVLSHLERVGGRMLPREIAEVMELRTGTVTAMLDRLERVGFIERMPNPTDRRSTFVDLTRRGREVIDAHLTPFDTRVRREVPQQSHAEVAGYLRQLADIVQERRTTPNRADLAVTVHPVALLLRDAAAGTFPAPDGGWRRVPPWRDGVEAVLAFTGHAVLAIDTGVPDDAVAGVDGFGGAHHPRVLLDLAGPGGWIDSLDALLVLPVGDRGTPLVDRPDLDGHDRVGFARSVREDVRVLGRADGPDVATLARGIGGLAEISVELDPAHRGQGRSAAFIRAAAAAAPADDVVVAAVAPGNAASLRAFLAAGFQVVGSVQLLRPVRR